MEKNRANQLASFLIAVGILVLFAFSKKEEIDTSIEYSSYDEMMVLNKKITSKKKAIISTLEDIAYKEWEIDSVTLFLSKYPLMDSLLLKKLKDIEFEFGYSDLLQKIESSQSVPPESLTDSAMERRIEIETALLKEDLKDLNLKLVARRKMLDSLMMSNPFKYYLRLDRFK
ncbi:MAG TPA: hypothetical protein EYO07_01950 [Candidatus Marinimicrobia bacterium]|nr:hypothetical protein [Candidatus Neomarinimicrobiota bacterium]